MLSPVCIVTEKERFEKGIRDLRKGSPPFRHPAPERVRALPFLCEYTG
jgi:hypothetical protein